VDIKEIRAAFNRCEYQRVLDMIEVFTQEQMKKGFPSEELMVRATNMKALALVALEQPGEAYGAWLSVMQSADFRHDISLQLQARVQAIRLLNELGWIEERGKAVAEFKGFIGGLTSQQILEATAMLKELLEELH